MVPTRFNEVVERAQTGEEKAQEELLGILRPYLEQLAHGITSSPRASRSSSDLVQEALLRVWQRLDQFSGTDDDEQSWAMFRAWVGQIVKRLNLNDQRDRHTQKRQPPQGVASLQGGQGQEEARPGLEVPSGDPTASSRVRLNEEVQFVQAALDRLGNDPSVSVIRMHFFEGRSLRQIAEHLQISYDKVRQLFHTGMQQLERELGPLR
jgi:RNA polymerase sigma factor (sigma-70 family)